MIEAIHANRVTDQEMQHFIGYCGWDTGELKAELNEGGWAIRN